jgi:hypothetical protein
MRDVMTAAGMLLVLGVPAWYVGSLLLRAAAFGWFVFAGVGLLLAGQGDQSPWAPVAFAGLGLGCWAAGHVLHRARRGMVGHPDRSARVLRTATASASRAARAPERGDARARPAALNRRCGDLSPGASDDASPSALAPTAHTV